jgi:purine-binding chemotaxis protein CheW
MERARPVAREASAEGRLDVVEFLLAHESYAIESRFVAEVFPFGDITPLPGTPAFVVGIINFRGSVLSVIDLKFFFQLPIRGLNDRNRAVILRSDSMEFGVLVDAMRGTRQIAQGSLQEALPTLSGIREKYLKGITADGVVVLDGGKLLADASLVVQQS